MTNNRTTSHPSIGTTHSVSRQRASPFRASSISRNQTASAAVRRGPGCRAAHARTCVNAPKSFPSSLSSSPSLVKPHAMAASMPKALLEQQTCSPARSRVRPFLRHLYGASMERQLICSRGGGKEGEESETGSFLLSLALSVIAGASLIEPLHCDRRSLPSCAAPVGERAGAG